MKYKRRQHTECETMIKEIKELKESGEVMQNMFFARHPMNVTELSSV